jgi:hypothetical protein
MADVQFEVGDNVTYEDANTGELKYGRITNMTASDAIIRESCSCP